MKKSERAFTRIELFVTSGALLLLSAVITSALGGKMNPGRDVCFNNLRLIGRAVQTWASDHGQEFSWRTLQSAGGTLPDSGVKPGIAWFEYFSLSNELVTPKILACPGDASAKPAATFFEFPSVGYRNNAVSYPLHLDGSMDLPRSWLSADRNFRVFGGFSGCSARVNNGSMIDTAIPPASSPVAWTNGAVHHLSGHVLTTDGSVELTSTERLKEILLAPGTDDNGRRHFLPVR